MGQYVGKDTIMATIQTIMADLEQAYPHMNFDQGNVNEWASTYAGQYDDGLLDFLVDEAEEDHTPMQTLARVAEDIWDCADTDLANDGMPEEFPELVYHLLGAHRGLRMAVDACIDTEGSDVEDLDEYEAMVLNWADKYYPDPVMNIPYVAS